jgi:hypothetical protein
MPTNFGNFTDTNNSPQNDDFVVGFDTPTSLGERRWKISSLANSVSSLMTTQLQNIFTQKISQSDVVETLKFDDYFELYIPNATRTNFGLTLTDGSKWVGGVLAPNGKIYGIPLDATDVLVINPENNTATRTNFGLTLTDSNKWIGGVLAPNGKIYGIPLQCNGCSCY